ncbi:Basic secretory protease (Fragments) [Linum grandiflorum]
MAAITFLLSLLLLLAASAEAADKYPMVNWKKIDYVVTNKAGNTSPGGVRFKKELGESYAKRTMMLATAFAWRVFDQLDGVPASSRKPVQKIELVLVPFQYHSNGTGSVRYVAYVRNASVIVMDSDYLGTFKGDLKREFGGLVYNQVATILQWKGNGEAPTGVTTGITDYVRMKAGFDGSFRVAAGQGKRWDGGYDVTGKFLEYCNKLKRGFVAELNAKMRNGYTRGYFVDILGKNVDLLWSEYKASYPKGHY